MSKGPFSASRSASAYVNGSARAKPTASASVSAPARGTAGTGSRDDYRNLLGYIQTVERLMLAMAVEMTRLQGRVAELEGTRPDD